MTFIYAMLARGYDLRYVLSLDPYEQMIHMGCMAYEAEQMRE